jgi:hypothetical protein
MANRWATFQQPKFEKLNALLFQVKMKALTRLRLLQPPPFFPLSLLPSG